MNRIILSVFLLFSTTLTLSVKAQDLASRVPADAQAVVTIKGKNLTQLLSIKEFNSSAVGKKILEALSKEFDGDIKDAQNLGINLESNFYYYNQANDSVSYNCVLIPLKNAKLLDILLSNNKEHKIATTGNLRTLYEGDSTEVTIWDDNVLLLAKADASYGYFDREEVAARFGIENPNDTGDSTATAAIDTVSAETQAETLEQIEQAEEIVTQAEEVPAAENVQEAEEETSEDTLDADSTSIDLDAYSQRTIKINKVLAVWLVEMAKSAFNQTTKASILENKSYLKSLDNDAEASLWISNMGNMFSSFTGSSSYLKSFKFFEGYRGISSKLYLENDQIRLTTALELDEPLASTYKKIADSKINRKFLKYINEDKNLGYLSFSFNSKAYLEEYPKQIAKMYGFLFEDEAAMITDLVSLILDEKALSNVFKGNGLLLLTGLNEKQVTYKTYDYDEDFNSTEVEKTKKETLPDFLFMTSTKDDKLLQKLFSYGEKKKVLVKNSFYYQLKVPKNPMDLFFMIKDGIIFIGTSDKEMEDIARNTFNAKLSKEHRRIIVKNNFATYFNTKKIAGKIPEKGLEDFASAEKATSVLGGMGNILLKSNKIKDNIVSGEISMNVGSTHPNSLQYLFSLLEKAIKE